MRAAGFAGLGNIGLPMARNLLGKAWRVRVYDVRPEPVAELAREGAEVATTPAELAATCAYIGVCVRDDDDLEAFLEGEAGLLRGARDGALVEGGAILALHSTLSLQAIHSAAARAEPMGIRVLDAPMSGGVFRAAKAELTSMVGGDPEALDQARPFLASSGPDVIHCGPLGTGMAAKLCNNLLGYAAYAATSEALLLARAAGLGRERLEEVTTSSGIMTPAMADQAGTREQIELGLAAPDTAALMHHAVALAEKDLRLALELGEALGVELPHAANVRDHIAHTFGTPALGPREE